jgi:hypothetical protein
MSVRSSRRSLALVALAFAACKPSVPEADPAKVSALAKKLVTNMPGMAAVRQCTDADYAGVTTLTFRSLLQLSGEAPSEKEPRDAEWINPPALDSASIRGVLDAKDATAKRQAAAQVLKSKAFLLYKVDVVNAPMALLVKELKTGTILSRVIRYEANGQPTCVSNVDFQNDRAKSDWAIEASDQALIDPAVAKALRDDLAAQYLIHAPGQPKPPATPPKT